MAKITITNFGGMAPRINPAALALPKATLAKNCILGNGDIRPLQGTVDVLTPAKVGAKKSIFRLGNTTDPTLYWLTWTTDVDVARGAIAGDPTERLYYTGDGPPKMTTLALATQGSTVYPATFRALGVPAPTMAPTATADSIPPGPNGTSPSTYKRAYVVTYVTDLGEEGPPSPPSMSVTVQDGTRVRLTALPTAPSGAYSVVAKRIYRTEEGAYRFTAEIPIATTTFDDTVPGASLGEELKTLGFTPPPAGLMGLCTMQNGIMAGFSGNDVMFCVAYMPYAWPVEYMLTMNSPVVAIASFGQSLVVGTTSNPHLITGIDPAAMSEERLDIPQACVSKRSMISVGSGVVYASPDGLVYIGLGGSRMVTAAHFTGKEWQAFRPESMHCAWYDNTLYVFYDNGTTKGALIFSSLDGNGDLSITDVWADATYVDPLTDALYLMDNTRNKIVRFNAGQNLTWEYSPPTLVTGDGFTPSAGRVLSDGYPVEFTLTSDTGQSYTATVSSPAPFRLPGWRSEWYKLLMKCSAGGRAYRVDLATSMTELRQS